MGQWVKGKLPQVRPQFITDSADTSIHQRLNQPLVFKMTLMGKGIQ